MKSTYLHLQSVRSPGLDTLRAMAILLVIPFHASFVMKWPLLKTLFGFGWVGVDLFFVLSGFLIGAQLLQIVKRNGKIDFGDFYIRRSFRILPAYLCILFLYSVWPDFRESKLISPYWQFITFTMNLFKNEKAFSHAWSLCVEEHFYLFLPLIMTMSLKFPKVFKAHFIIPFLFLFGIGIRMVLWANNGDFYTQAYHSTYCRLDGLVLGFTLALLKEHRTGHWESLLKNPNLLTLSGILFVCVGIYVLPFTGEKGFLAWVIAFPLVDVGMACLVIAAQASHSWLANLHVLGTSACASLAYCLYLTHKQMIHLALKVFSAEERVPLILTSVVFIIIGACLLHFIVEKPFLRLREVLQKNGNVVLI